MASETLVKRVEALERQMSEISILPDHVEDISTRLSQFQARVEAEFSAMVETLRAEIRAGDEETRHQMRVLHEDVIGRLALLQEGLLPRRTTRAPSKKKGPGRNRTP